MEQLHNVTVFQFILMFLGLLLNVLFSIEKRETTDEKFSSMGWVKKHIITIIISIILSSIGVVLGKDLFTVFGIAVPDTSNLLNVNAFLCGLLSHLLANGARKLMKLIPRDSSDTDVTPTPENEHEAKGI